MKKYHHLWAQNPTIWFYLEVQGNVVEILDEASPPVEFQSHHCPKCKGTMMGYLPKFDHGSFHISIHFRFLKYLQRH